MELYGYQFIRENDLYHHGIKGQKWGIRRFQNPDGSLTEAGKKRLQKKAEQKYARTWTDAYNDASNEFNKRIGSINAKYEGYTFDDSFSTKMGQKYVREVNSMWKEVYRKALRDRYNPEYYGKIGLGEEWVTNFYKNAYFMNEYEQYF